MKNNLYCNIILVTFMTFNMHLCISLLLKLFRNLSFRFMVNKRPYNYISFSLT